MPPLPPLPAFIAGPRYGWLVGLPLLGLVWAGAGMLAVAEIETALERAGQAIVDATGENAPEPWLRVSAEGRDLVARGEAPDEAGRDAALARLAALPGLRLIRSETAVIGEADPFVWSALRSGPDRIAVSGSRPAEIGRAALARHLAGALPPVTVLADETHAARGAPPDFAAAATFAIARLPELKPGARATLTGTVLALSGEAASAEAYDGLRAALGAPPQGYSLGSVAILPPNVADPRFIVERRRDGGVVLTGQIPSEAMQERLRPLAAEVADGAPVDDRTQPARGLPPSLDAEVIARFALRLAGLLREGSVRYEAGRVAVSGDALDRAAQDEIAALLRDARPAGIGAGPLSVTASPLSPYRVAIRRNAESVTLAGHLPDEAARQRLLSALRPRFFRERIVDRTRLAEGAPQGLVPALEAGLQPLALLASGEIAAADRTIALSGESLYPQSAERAGDALKALPAGWTGTVAVASRETAERREIGTCRSQLAAEAGESRLHFEPGSALLNADLYPTLDAVAAIARACPDLRIAVAGHRDPPGTQPKSPPAAETAVPATASISPAPDKGTEGKSAKPAHKPADKHAAKEAAGGGKPAKTGGAAEKRPAAKPADSTASAEAASPEVAPDLARQRALAVLDYLLAAGIPAERVAVADEVRQASIGLEARP